MYNFVAPANTKTYYKGGNSYYSDYPLSESWQRAKWEYRIKNENPDWIRSGLVNRLTTGFANPNGTLAWTILLSDLSAVDAERIIKIAKQADLTGGRYDWSEQYEDEKLVSAMLFLEGYFRNWSSLDSKNIRGGDAQFINSLAIVDCGWETSRSYENLAHHSKALIRKQIGASSWMEEFSKMADPTALRENIHGYIDALVTINNEVQRYCKYAQSHATIPEIEFAHSLEWRDEEIEEISKSAPAVLFCNGLKDSAAISARTRLRHPELCLV
jgi:hypothetical protein